MAEQRTARSLKRIAILASILVMLAVTLMPTLRSYLRQQGEIATLRTQVAQQEDSVAALQQEQQQWGDPAYVEQQARDRLKFVRPGERSYTVVDAEPAPDKADDAPKVAAPPADGAGERPWYGRLWQSMVLVDAPVEASVTVPAVPRTERRTTPSRTPPTTSAPR